MRDLGSDWVACMRRGDEAASWVVSDDVLAARDPATRDDPTLPYHKRWVWDGRPFDGSHVLVRCYHGLGDTLQYARFLPFLRKRVASLAFEVQTELLPLLRSIPGPDKFIAFDVDAPAPPAECDIEIMELSHALRMASCEAPAPYLAAQASQMPQGAIGLCTSAGNWDSDRSIAPALFQRLAEHKPVFMLQPLPSGGGLRVLNPQGCATRIEDVARQICGLSLIITVDTMVAHLAGALGRPTWLLLKHDADWRWMERCTNSPWYKSMRCYRQPSPGDWHSVVRSVMHDLSHAG